MKNEIYKYPYNGRIGDETKTFLSDKICEQALIITYRKGQFFCIIKDKATSKTKEITLSAVFIFVILFGRPNPAQSIGITPIPRPVDEIHRPAPKHFHQPAPKVNSRLDKIRMMPTNDMISLTYIHGYYSYINEQRLKKLRSGNLSGNLAIIALSILVYVMFELSGVDAFPIIMHWNAPTSNPGLSPSTSHSSTEIALVPT